MRGSNRNKISTTLSWPKSRYWRNSMKSWQDIKKDLIWRLQHSKNMKTICKKSSRHTVISILRWVTFSTGKVMRYSDTRHWRSQIMTWKRKGRVLRLHLLLWRLKHPTSKKKSISQYCSWATKPKNCRKNYKKESTNVTNYSQMSNKRMN